MALAEILVMSLGPSIAKAIFRLWLEDGIAIAVTDSLTDLIAKKTTKKLEQHRLKRTFDDLGERIAGNLITIFQKEGLSLTEGDQIAVVECAATALDHTKINVRTLAECQFEPNIFEERLKQAIPDPTRGFSEVQTALYFRLLSELSQDVVDIVPTLPGFTEQSLVLLLQQGNAFLGKLDDLLDDFRAYREDSGTQFESDYLRAVRRTLDKLVLFGAGVSLANKRQKLSIAYITLAAKADFLKGSGSHPIARFDESKYDESKYSEGEFTSTLTGLKDKGQPDTVVVPVNVILGRSRRLLIRGEAGSGKTTLLKWIAVQMAQKNFDGDLAPWNNKIPFFISLREVLEGEFPTPQQFPGLISKFVGENTPNSWAHEQLRSGRAVVLIDGVDEIPANERESMWEWLDELINTYESRTTFIVTSRPHAVDKDMLASFGFNLTELQPMSFSDIEQFIDHWHRAVISEYSNDNETIAHLNDLASNLKHVLRGNRSLRELATSPLLCAMICALHRESESQLPDDRIELYRRTCRMLIERDIQKSVKLSDYPKLSYRQQFRLLANLAYAITVSGRSEITYEQAQLNLDGQLEVMNSDANPTGEKVLRYLLERTGIIRQPSVDRVDFTHRTFQEFLAANAAVHNYHIQTLINNAHDDQWREVIILAAGLASQRDLEELINGLLARGDELTNGSSFECHLLAAASLDMADQRDDNIYQAVSQRVEQIMPPQSREEATALATAGDLAVPFLARYTNASTEVAAHCVYSLTKIATEDALHALKGFANQRSETPKPIKLALLESLAHIQDKEYMDELLQQLHITLTDAADSLANANKHTEALHLYNQQLYIAEQRGNIREEAEVMAKIAEVLRDQGRYDEALEMAHKSLTAWEQLGEPGNVAQAQDMLAIIALLTRNYNKALEMAHKSLTAWEQLGEGRNAANAQYLIALTLRKLGDLDEALEMVYKSLANSEKYDDLYRVATAQEQIVLILREQGRYDEALEMAYKSLVTREQAGEPFWVAHTQHLIAEVLRDLGRLDEALEITYKNLATSEQVDNLYGVADAQHLITEVLHEQEKLDEALEMAYKSLATREHVGGPYWMADAQRLIAEILREQEKLDEALEFANESLATSEQVSNQIQVTYAQRVIAEILRDQGKLHEALEFANLSLTGFEQIGDRDAAKKVLRVIRSISKNNVR